MIFDGVKIGNRRYQLMIAGISLAALVYIMIINAWVVDDAYITFRTVDNFIHGYGLRWNIDERVQVYTHPLWMLVISFFYFFTLEAFYTSIAVSILCSLGAVIVSTAMLTKWFRTDLWKAILFIVALGSSKAFIDYTTSGLENALSYLIAALFFSRLSTVSAAVEKMKREDILVFFSLASFAFLNRADTILLYLPVLLYLVAVPRSFPFPKLAMYIFLAALPAMLWIVFSTVYYGFPFPNTLYAKVVSVELPAAWKAFRGMQYLLNSICWDAGSYFFIIAAMVWWLKTKELPTACALAGVCLYFLYVIFFAASSTHMSGRFFAVPIFIVMILFADVLDDVRFGTVLIGILILYMAWNPVSSIKFGTAAYHPYDQHPSFMDTKWVASQENGALINMMRGGTLSDHPWFRDGEKFRNTPQRVYVGGAGGSVAIGYFGYAAGPEKFIIDPVGLTDPLLARLPSLQPKTINRWQSGHPGRRIPEGYIESVERDTNLIVQNDIRNYYEKIRIITRGEIFTMQRFKLIFHMNTGDYGCPVAAEQVPNSREPGGKKN